MPFGLLFQKKFERYNRKVEANSRQSFVDLEIAILEHIKELEFRSRNLLVFNVIKPLTKVVLGL